MRTTVIDTNVVLSALKSNRSTSYALMALLTKDYLGEEAKKATREDFDKVMRAVPDTEPDEYDRF